MPKQSNLHSRNGRFYIRVRVPKDLIPLLDKKEIKYSLGTSNRREALERLAVEFLKVQQRFASARKKHQSGAKPPSPELTRTEIERVVLVWHHNQMEEIARRTDSIRTMLDEDSLEEVLQPLRDALGCLGSRFERAYMQIVSPTLDDVFGGEGLELPTDKESRSFAINLVHQGLIEQTFHELERLGEKSERTPFSFFDSPKPESSNSGSRQSSISLKTLCDKFSSAKLSDGVTEKSLASYKLTIDFAIELFGGQREISTITSEDCRTYRDRLRRLPSNAKKKYPRLPLLDAINAHKDSSTLLSVTSVNRHLTNLSTVLKFALQEGYLEKNPASHIKQLRNKTGKKKGRVPFKPKELQAIFSAPIYTGCKDDERGYRIPGANHPKRHRYWVPLIGLYTGMRLNEICQLLVSDIRKSDGISYFKVEANDEESNTLKTVQSERIVPIHPELLKIGFLEYVSSVKNRNQKRLFPDIVPSSSGSYSSTFTKWFSNFLNSVDVKRKGTCFHSFRHSFRDAMREAEINRELAAQLGGWKNSDAVMDHYGEGFKIESLNKAIQSISYPDLTLSHLDVIAQI